MDDAADPIFELRNDFAAAIVRRRIGGEQNQHIEIKLDRITANLHVAFFQNIEQPDLY